MAVVDFHTHLKHAITDKATTDDCRIAIHAYRPAAYFDKEYHGIKRRTSRELTIMLFGPSGAGKSSFFNSVVCAYTGMRNVGHLSWFPVDQIEHEHKEEKEVRRMFARQGCFTGLNINLLETRGATWVDPDWDTALIHRSFLGLMEFVAYPSTSTGTEQYSPKFNMLHGNEWKPYCSVDLVVFAIPATANQRQVDYMRVLCERLKFMGIPYVCLATKQDLLKSQKGPFSLGMFKADSLHRVENYRYGGPDYCDEMNRCLLSTFCKFIEAAEFNLHVLHDPQVIEREKKLMFGDQQSFQLAPPSSNRKLEAPIAAVLQDENCSSLYMQQISFFFMLVTLAVSVCFTLFSHLSSD